MYQITSRTEGAESTWAVPGAMATTLFDRLYAAPAWWGLTLPDDRLRRERLQRKMHWMYFISSDMEPLAVMAYAADALMLRAVTGSDEHVLLRLFTPIVLRPIIIYILCTLTVLLVYSRTSPEAEYVRDILHGLSV